MIRAAAAAVVLAAALSRGAAGQSSAGFSEAFDRVDRQAQRVTAHLSCVSRATVAERTGVAPAADSAGTHLICAELRRGLVAAYVATDSSWKRATRLVAVDPERGVRITEPVDTAEILVLLRAQRYSQWLVSRSPDDTVGFLPVVYRVDTTIHVWMIPESILPMPTPSTGGERRYVFPADARKELYADPVPPRRPIKPPTAGEWMVESSDSIPSFSEMLFANMMNMDGQPVAIVMPTKVARLVGPPRRAVWVFVSKKP